MQTNLSICIAAWFWARLLGEVAAGAGALDVVAGAAAPRSVGGSSAPAPAKGSAPVDVVDSEGPTVALPFDEVPAWENSEPLAFVVVLSFCIWVLPFSGYPGPP